jgi:hypothetical protein
MKRLLLIAAALLALTGAASAVEMPKELRGVWCLDIDRHVYTREGECTVRSGFLIGVRGFDIPNNGYCTVLKMRQFGKHAYRSKFRCRDDDGAKPLIINYTWQIENDILTVRSR